MGAEPVDAARVVVERERDELVQPRRVERGRGQRDDEEAFEVAGGDGDRGRVGGSARLGQLDQRADDGGDQQPLALRRLLRVGADRRAGGRGGEQAVAVLADRDLHRRAVARALERELRAAGAQRPEQQPAQARGRGGRRAGAAGVAQGGGELAHPAASIAAWNVARAGSPRTANTIRSSSEPASRWRRTSSTSIRAASSSGKPPTPVPNATSARLRAPSSSARASVDAVARRDDLRGRRPAELHRRRVDDPAAGHRAAGRLDRLAQPDRGAAPRLLVDRRSTRARDRGRHATAVQQPRVGRVGDRVHLERRDVGVERLDRGHRSTVPA